MLTKKELLEAIEDMPDDTLICLSPNGIEYYVVENIECYKNQKTIILC